MPSFLSDLPSSGIVRLRCGTQLDLGRSRWDGPLSQAEVIACRRAGIPLSYDPAQIGWVLAERLTREEYARLQQAGPRATHPSATQSRLGMRPWRTSDLDDYVRLLDDPAIWTHLPEPYPAPLTRDMARALIELSNASNHHEVRAVTQADTPIGQVRLLFDGAEDLGCAEISYWLGRDHWGNGIASDMVGRYTRQCFDQHPQLNSIYARVHDQNTASARVLAKSGYRHHGVDPDRTGWQVFQQQRQGQTAH